MWRSFDGDNVPKSILLFTLGTTCGCVITSRFCTSQHYCLCSQGVDAVGDRGRVAGEENYRHPVACECWSGCDKCFERTIAFLFFLR